MKKFDKIEDIEKHIEKMQKNIVKELSNTAKVDLIKAHDEIIDNFYADYTPLWYHRHASATENLYSTLLSSYVKKGYAMIKVGSADMGKHNADNGYIFDLVWEQGIRGLPEQSSDGSWINPFWSEGEPYHSIFRTTISGSSVSSPVLPGTPDLVMLDFIDNWVKKTGNDRMDELWEKID